VLNTIIIKGKKVRSGSMIKKEKNNVTQIIV